MKQKIIKFILMLLCITALVFSCVKITYYIKDENNISSLQRGSMTAELVSLTEKHYSDVTLLVKHTLISYDVMQGEDNEYYLTHTPDGEYNKAGWIFFDYRVNKDSRNKIIYGHNRVTGSMFGSLSNLTMPSYYDKYGTDTIYLEEKDKISVYRIFAVYTVNKDFNYLICDFEDNEKFMEYLSKVRKLNKIEALESVVVDEESEILTLSTCSGVNDRLVVQAVKVEEREGK